MSDDAGVTKAQWTTLFQGSGAVLLGGLCSLFLSGVVFMQIFLYWRIYPTDPRTTKLLVLLIWVLDSLHSAMVCLANWEDLVVNFGRFNTLDVIPWSIACTVALTATTTFIVQMFFVHRVHTLSRGNWYLTVPLGLLALLRLAAAIVSTTMMIRLRSYSEFVVLYSSVFSLGLVASFTVDIFITSSMWFYLRQWRNGIERSDHIIDALTRYSVETGAITTCTTFVSLVCWLSMPDNLIFLGLHLLISKLYANSFLASLNARRGLATKGSAPRPGGAHEARHGAGPQRDNARSTMPVIFPTSYNLRNPGFPWVQRARPTADSRPQTPKAIEVRVDVNVERSVQVDGEPALDLDLDLSRSDPDPASHLDLERTRTRTSSASTQDSGFDPHPLGVVLGPRPGLGAARAAAGLGLSAFARTDSDVLGSAGTAGAVENGRRNASDGGHGDGGGSSECGHCALEHPLSI
ncbi:uncharacterized protein BXZ73DRAFT_102433 [Epithele typhae]|uniref:uncharacterized protein n=1 Tax=Epithele typhae TaxID=378194 RepID=UPI00200890D4|nr:uncharacterized protein BXZ73DRAFT_102433 [Epithele typhae]KAH9927924.1 hypothetical protein BXZ73DRAFT_102433 [Epithele typhae]